MSFMKMKNKLLAPYFVVWCHLGMGKSTIRFVSPRTEDPQGKISRHTLYSDKEIYFQKKRAWVYPVIPHNSSLILVED